MRRKYCYLAGHLRQLDMTQNDLAHEIGISRTALNHRMTGRTPWTLEEMYQILHLLNAPDSELYLYFPYIPQNK